ncbi:hypothetical protein ACFZDF_30605 [Streptomyces sp. NPDC007910]|uniref:hypothetical protein n=1 Tax=Streptomyces sp. NPDC007910 TaxID=3364790 RepID=UPI0036E65F42
MSAPTSAQWLRAAARRIAKGSEILALERTKRLIGWVRSVWARTMTWLGEASGIAWVVRLAVLLGAAWLLRKIALGIAGAVARRLEATPSLMWIALALWLIAAWRAGDPKRPAPAVAEAEEPAAEEGPLAGMTVDEIRALLIDMLGTDAQVHLKVLAERLTGATRRPWETADVRAAVERAGGQVEKGVRMPGRTPSTGVRRKTLPDPSPTPPPPPVEGVVVAGQEPSTGAATATPTAPATPTPERGEERRAQPIGQGGVVVHDPAETVRHHAVRA